MDQTYMKEKPVVPLLLSMGIPVIISMIAGALYNIVDSIFVAMISEDAMTAVSLVYPIQNLAHAAGVGFGVGINAMVARRLGEGKTRMANQTASQGVFLSALHGMILTILGMAVIPYFLRMFTSDEVTISYGLTYFCNVFLFSTIDTMGMAYEKVYQSVGKMKISMAAVLIGCVVNIVLDPIFIFGLGPGTSGAALATALSQIISFCILFFMCNTKKECITILPQNFRPTINIYQNIIYGGIPSLGRQGIASVATIIMNIMAHPYGDAAIAAMSIVSRFMMFINSAIIGFGQGFQPVCSFCFGAKMYARVKEACWFCIKVSTAILLVFCVTGFAFSGHIIELFRKGDADVIRIGTLALRLQLMTLPLQGVIIMGNMMPQSIGYGIRATLVSIGRQGLFLIPALLILTPVFGLLGIQISQPIADLCTFFLAAFVMNGIFKEMDAAK